MDERLDLQLFTLFQKLGLLLTNQNDYGTTIGYAIVASLADYTTTSGSEQERRFEQVKKIYEGLGAVVDRITNGEESYSVFCDLRVKARQDTDTSTATKAQDNDSQSDLYEIIVEDLARHRGSYEDILRRHGLRLIEIVTERGVQKGRRNIFEHDYKAIEEVFTDSRT